jgi:hypothetical protein
VSEPKKQAPPELVRSLKDREISLIHLESRTRSEGKIGCRLEIADMDTARYEALSCERGPVSPKLSITVDENGILVRENLSCALRHLQLENGS